MAKKKKELKTTTLSPPASSVEPWVIEQLGKRPKESWVRDQLQYYYNKEILDLKLESMQKEMDSRLASLEEEADDTQRIFIEQRGKWSKIPKRHEVDDLKTVITGWSAWFRRVLVGIILFLIGTGGVSVWRYAELNAELRAALQDMEEVREENDELRNVQARMEKQIEMLINFMRHPDVLNSYRVGPSTRGDAVVDEQGR